MPTECFLLMCWVLMQLVKASDDVQCFHFPASDCPGIGDTCRCTRGKEESSSVKCCNIHSDAELKEALNCSGVVQHGVQPESSRKKTLALHLRNATLDKLDVSAAAWKTLVSFSVTDSKIQHVMGMFDDQNPLVCLNLSSNSLTEINYYAVQNSHSLAMLDLSYNKLTSLPLIKDAQQHFQLDISGNRGMNCSSITDLMKAAKEKSKNVHFRNEKNATFCTLSKHFSWFNSSEVIPLEQVAVLNKLNEDCPRTDRYTCTCAPARVEYVPGQQPTFTARVDCSNNNLMELPPNLPPNTVFLNVSFNNITSLDLLSTDPSYFNLREFHADHNEIDSIAKLEGTRFIDNFITLSLRSNNLNSILTYILSNTFDRNLAHEVRLGKNMIVCNCSTAQTLKWWLNANKRYIPDYEEILCKNHPERVIDLDQNKVCPFQTDWTDYIYYVIAGEIAMFLLLIGKVTYDYWVFKTHGYLPWPASKMPKMPCDWVFET